MPYRIHRHLQFSLLVICTLLSFVWGARRGRKHKNACTEQLTPKPRASLEILINGTETPMMAAISVDAIPYLYRMLPFVVSGWKRYGVNCIIFLVGMEKKSEGYRELISELAKMGSMVIVIPTERLGGYKALVTQQVRIYAAFLPLSEDTILFPSDADIHPGYPDHLLRAKTVLKTKSLYAVQPMVAKTNSFRIPYSCTPKISPQTRFNELFLCYVAMRVGVWRKLLGVLGTEFRTETLPESVIEQMRKVYGWKIQYRILKKVRRFSQTHLIFSDQQMLAMMLHFHFFQQWNGSFTDYPDAEIVFRETSKGEMHIKNPLKRRMTRSVGTNKGKFAFDFSCKDALVYDNIPHEMHGGCDFNGDCLDRLSWFARCIYTPPEYKASLREYCLKVVGQGILLDNSTRAQEQCRGLTTEVEWPEGKTGIWSNSTNSSFLSKGSKTGTKLAKVSSL